MSYNVSDDELPRRGNSLPTGFICNLKSLFDGFQAVLRAALDGACFLCRMVSELCQNLVWRSIYGSFGMLKTCFAYNLCF